MRGKKLCLLRDWALQIYVFPRITLWYHATDFIDVVLLKLLAFLALNHKHRNHDDQDQQQGRGHLVNCVVGGRPWQTPSNNQLVQYSTVQYSTVYIYISIAYFRCFSFSYSLTCCVCLFRSSTVLYQQEQRWRVLYQHLCHHDDVLPSSKCNRNITAAATTNETRSDNGNGNRDMQTTHSSGAWTGNCNRKMGYEQYYHELLTMTMLNACHYQQQEIDYNQNISRQLQCRYSRCREGKDDVMLASRLWRTP